MGFKWGNGQHITEIRTFSETYLEIPLLFVYFVHSDSRQNDDNFHEKCLLGKKTIMIPLYHIYSGAAAIAQRQMAKTTSAPLKT